MGSVVRILMERDGFSREDAVEEFKSGMEAVMAYIYDGDYESAEEEFESAFGLEPDYLMGIVGC